MDRHFRQKIIRNTVVTVCARILLLMIAIILTPYILSKIGNEEYGIWVLISAVVGYVGVLDFGFGTSFVKYVAEYDARGDHVGVNGVLSAGLIFYGIISGLILVLVIPNIGVVLGLLTVPNGLKGDARLVLGLGIVTFICTNFTGVYQSVINGLQRMDVSYGIVVSMSVWNAIGIIVALEWGYGIRGLAINQLITQVVGGAVIVYWACRLYPGLKVSLRTNKQFFVTLGCYGLNLQIGRMAELINFQFDKLLVNRFVDASHVTFYEIGSRVPATLRSFPAMSLSALTPAYSELDVRESRAQIYELFSRASKYVSVIAFPLFTGIIVMSQVIIEAWVGGGYEISALVMRILSVGYLLNVVVGGVSPLVQGMGKPEYQRNAESLSLLLNVLLSVLLINRYGFYGAAIGTTIAMSASSVYFVWSVHRFMARPLLPFLKRTFMKSAVCAGASGLLGLAIVSALRPYASGSRVSGLVTFVVAGCVFSFSYVLLILKWKYFDDQEIALLRKYLPFISS